MQTRITKWQNSWECQSPLEVILFNPAEHLGPTEQDAQDHVQFWISAQAEIPHPVSTTCSSLTSLTVGEKLSYVQRKCSELQFVPTASSPGHRWQLCSIFFTFHSSILLVIFVAFCWTLSNKSISPFCWWAQHPRCVSAVLSRGEDLLLNLDPPVAH